MATGERYLMQVTVDIPPEKEAEWNDWYSQVHVPDILRVPGFKSARRYVSVFGTGPRYTTIYEIEGPQTIQSEEFQRARGWGAFAPYVIDPRLTVYKEFFSLPA